MIENFKDFYISPELLLRKDCGAGKTIFSLNEYGDLFPCHMLHFEEFKLGNVLYENLKDIFNKKSIQKFLKLNVDDIECKNCEYKYFCGGGYRARAFYVNKNIETKDPYCSVYINFYDKIFYELSKAGEE
nr:SPASM domain-containing protein [Marinitoga sp. 38H-ov]